MKTLLLSLLLSIAAIAQSPEERTKALLDQILAQKYDAFYALFTPKMQSLISLQAYSTQMRQIAALGPPQSVEAPHSSAAGDDTVVVVTVHWVPVSLDFQVSWNKDGQVDGTYWRPVAAPQAPWQSPPYSHPDSFTTTELTIGDDQWKLPATLTVPTGDGPFPLVVLVHGSGPEDRDETIGPSKVFRDLAEGLASRNVAVLRYVKRTKQYPRESAADPTFTVNQETVDDAVRAADLARKQPRINPSRVFVLGHSQGGYMAPRIMERAPKLAGFIVMAGNVRSLEELIVDQTQYLASLKGPLTAEDQAHIAAVKRNPFGDFQIPAPYLADLKNYRPDLAAKALHMPMLILQGERDYQVTMKDFAMWKMALGNRPDVTFHSYPKLNHLFIAGEGKPSPAEYQKPGHVDEQVIADIVQWVRR